MKKILLPTDFSCNSTNAISYALNFYKDDVCEFSLLHTLELNGFIQKNPLSPVGEKETCKVQMQKCIQKLNKLIQEIKRRYPNKNHSYKPIFKYDNLVDSINQEVESSSFEVIIIGSQGEANAKRIAYGKNTIHLMEDVVNCPLLAIPSHVKFSEIKEIVLATGLKTEPKSQEYNFIKELLIKTKSILRILFIEEDGDFTRIQINNKKILFNLLEGVNFTFHTLSNVPVNIGIYCFVESRGSDMIAFINKKYNFFKNVLFNPQYKDLRIYSRIPVLIFQNSNSTKSVLQEDLTHYDLK